MSSGATPTTHVLLLAAHPEARERFGTLFNISGLSTAIVADLAEMERRLAAGPVDVLLIATDASQSPLLEALTLVRRGNSLHRDLPVVVALPEGTPLESALECMHEGAYDYIIEPFNEIELLTKLTVLARIKYAEDEFRELAVKDRLTGIYDRRYLQMRATEELSRARRYKVPLAMVVIDLEGTTLINEQYGVEAGDALLRLVAVELNQIKRHSDVLARLEGDEFAIIFYNCTAEGALILADRIRKAITMIIPPFESSLRPSASIGIALSPPENHTDPVALIDQAEQACQTAAAQGRGAMVLA